MGQTTKAVLGGLALGGALIWLIARKRETAFVDAVTDGIPMVPLTTPGIAQAVDRGNPMTGIRPSNVQWSWTGKH